MISSSSRTFLPMSGIQFFAAVCAMCAVVVGSNILVQFPINQWLTWGAISYPCAFLVADLLNRRFGPQAARRVAYLGFMIAIVVSVWVATPRIAIASGLAFLLAQLLDIHVFHRLRHRAWRGSSDHSPGRPVHTADADRPPAAGLWAAGWPRRA